VYHNFYDVTTDAVLFREMVSINYRNLVKIVRAVFDKVAILFLWAHLKSTNYEVLLESSRTVIVTALVKEDERGGQGHTSASLLHQSAT
jgi:hypothetical protein